MGEQQSPVRNIAFFVALFSTALALGAALAHALEFPNKIGLARESYFAVQPDLSWLVTAGVTAGGGTGGPAGGHLALSA
jgi:hypothetical protein